MSENVVSAANTDSSMDNNSNKDALRIRMLLAKMLDFESNNLLVQIRSLLIQKDAPRILASFISRCDGKTQCHHDIKHVRDMTPAAVRRSYRAHQLLCSEEKNMSFLLTDNLKDIVFELFRALDRDSHGNLYHFSAVLKHIMHTHPLQAHEILNDNNLCVLLLDYLSEAPIRDVLVELFRTPPAQLHEIFARQQDTLYQNQAMDAAEGLTCSPIPPIVKPKASASGDLHIYSRRSSPPRSPTKSPPAVNKQTLIPPASLQEMLQLASVRAKYMPVGLESDVNQAKWCINEAFLVSFFNKMLYFLSSDDACELFNVLFDELSVMPHTRPFWSMSVYLSLLSSLDAMLKYGEPTIECMIRRVVAIKWDHPRPDSLEVLTTLHGIALSSLHPISVQYVFGPAVKVDNLAHMTHEMMNLISDDCELGWYSTVLIDDMKKQWTPKFKRKECPSDNNLTAECRSRATYRVEVLRLIMLTTMFGAVTSEPSDILSDNSARANEQRFSDLDGGSEYDLDKEVVDIDIQGDETESESDGGHYAVQTLDRWPVSLFKNLCNWLFSCPRNSQYQVLFVQIFHLILKKNHEPSLKAIFQNSRFLSMLIHALFNPEYSDLHAVLLLMCELLLSCVDELLHVCSSCGTYIEDVNDFRRGVKDLGIGIIRNKALQGRVPFLLRYLACHDAWCTYLPAVRQRVSDMKLYETFKTANTQPSIVVCEQYVKATHVAVCEVCQSTHNNEWPRRHSHQHKQPNGLHIGVQISLEPDEDMDSMMSESSKPRSASDPSTPYMRDGDGDDSDVPTPTSNLHSFLGFPALQ